MLVEPKSHDLEGPKDDGAGDGVAEPKLSSSVIASTEVWHASHDTRHGSPVPPVRTHGSLSDPLRGYKYSTNTASTD